MIVSKDLDVVIQLTLKAHLSFLIAYFGPVFSSEWADVWPDADSPAESFSSHHRAAGRGSWRRVPRGLQRGKTG